MAHPPTPVTNGTLKRLKKNRLAVAAFDGSDDEGERTPQHRPPTHGKLVYGGTRKLAALRPRGRL